MAAGGGGGAASIRFPFTESPHPTRSQPAAAHPTGPHARLATARGVASGSGISTAVHDIPPSVDSYARRDVVKPKPKRPETTGSPASRTYSPTVALPSAPISIPTTDPPASIQPPTVPDRRSSKPSSQTPYFSARATSAAMGENATPSVVAFPLSRRGTRAVARSVRGGDHDDAPVLECDAPPAADVAANVDLAPHVVLPQDAVGVLAPFGRRIDDGARAAYDERSVAGRHDDTRRVEAFLLDHAARRRLGSDRRTVAPCFSPQTNPERRRTARARERERVATRRADGVRVGGGIDLAHRPRGERARARRRERRSPFRHRAANRLRSPRRAGAIRRGASPARARGRSAWPLRRRAVTERASARPARRRAPPTTA